VTASALPHDSVRDRLSALRRRLRAADGFLVTDLTNLRYLAGFTGSSGFALVTRGGAVFATDFRYEEQSRGEVWGFERVLEKKSRVRTIRGLLRGLGVRRLCVESSVSHEFFCRLSSAAPEIKAMKGTVEKLRERKDAGEVALIREAVARAEGAFRDVRPFIKAGARERAVALRLEERLKKRGCRRLPFDIIVASGPNSALPHAGVTDRKLAGGDLVIIDWGGEAGGYYSDMTRTLLVKGGGAARQREIYGLVRRAAAKARAFAAPGLEAGAIDNSARDIIKKAGYGRSFGHALGHGVGLQVHELPRISPGRKERLKQGMVFTIEPGVYVPGLGGVRIEDMVAIGERGAERLTSLSTGLDLVS
jgi:Xaa-Pro aminopeptidase